MHLPTISTRTVAAALATALLALTLAACGGEAATDPTPTTTQPPAEATQPTEATRPAERPIGSALALPEEVTACLTDRGYADAIEAGAGTRDPDFQAALEECAAEAGVDLPLDGGGPAGGGRAGVDTGALAECLASEGIETDVDAPNGLLGTLDRADPEVAAALELCGFGGQGRGPAQ